MALETKKLTIEVDALDVNAYIASLDMAIALCMQKTTHCRAGDYLSKFRLELMEAYMEQVHPKKA